MTGKILRSLDAFWFSPAPAKRLAAMRILTGIYTIYFLVDRRSHYVDAASGGPEVFSPIGVCSWMTHPLSPGHYDVLLGVTVVFAHLFTFGIWHRVLAPLFGALLLFVLTYSNSWTMVFHTENMLVVHVLILSICRSADAYSLDSSNTADRPGLARWGFAQRASDPHFRYFWPIRLLQLGATLPYVIAGIAKVRGKAGWDWALGGNLRDQITMNGLYYDVYKGSAREITYHVYGWDDAFMAAAVMTLVVELGAPLALLTKKLGYLYVVSVMSMHWSIMFLMGIPFPYQLYGWAYVCFFDWDRIIAFIRRKISPLWGGKVGQWIDRLDESESSKQVKSPSTVTAKLGS